MPFSTPVQLKKKKLRFPAVAQAHDMQSLITSVNQIKHIIDILTNQFESAVHWVERSRKTEIVRVSNPENEDQWVEVERITHIVWQNTVTEELFEWVW
jgi:hypothetical protein